MTVAYKLDSVTKGFNHLDYEQTVLNQLSLVIDTGSIVSLVGGNGAGKSTLLNLLAGDLPYEAGEIAFYGQSLSERQVVEKMKQQIARVYQDPSRGTAGELTVFENMSLADVAQGSFNLRLAKQRQYKAHYAEQLAQLHLGLDTQLDLPVKRLSGGQRQALALLMAHLRQPKILLLDEHTAALDPKVSDRVMQLTEQLSRDSGVTTVMITHNLSDALTYGDRVVMLKEGQVFMDISGEEKNKLTEGEMKKRYK